MAEELMPLARELVDRIAPEPAEVGSFDNFDRWLADVRQRERSAPGTWYVVLPSWMPFQHGRTWEQFCAEFDESAKRTNIPRSGVVGFEIEPQAGQVRRHTIGWLGQPSTPPEEAPK